MTGWWAASYVILWGLVIALALLVLALARQVGTLHMRLGPRGALEMDEEGPPLGKPIPPLDVRDPDGGPASLGGGGPSRLILFVSPGCPVCREVLPGLPVAARAAHMEPVAVADVPGPEAAEAYAGRSPVPVLAGPEAARKLDVPGTPYALVLDGDGVVRAKGTVNHLEQLEGLVDTARRRLAPADGPRPARRA